MKHNRTTLHRAHGGHDLEDIWILRNNTWTGNTYTQTPRGSKYTTLNKSFITQHTSASFLGISEHFRGLDISNLYHLNTLATSVAPDKDAYPTFNKANEK